MSTYLVPLSAGAVRALHRLLVHGISAGPCEPKAEMAEAVIDAYRQVVKHERRQIAGEMAGGEESDEPVRRPGDKAAQSPAQGQRRPGPDRDAGDTARQDTGRDQDMDSIVK